MSTPSSPAGWYPDPTGGHQLRYFDGAQWTVHVADNGAQSTAPVTRAAPAQRQAQQPPAAEPVQAVQPVQPVQPVEPAQQMAPTQPYAGPAGSAYTAPPK